MNNREVARWEQCAKEIEHIPLSGPDIYEAFYVFAVRVTSNESIGKRKLTADKPYYLLDGFTIRRIRGSLIRFAFRSQGDK